MKLCNFGVDLNAKYVCKIWLKIFQCLKNKVHKTLEE